MAITQSSRPQRFLQLGWSALTATAVFAGISASAIHAQDFGNAVPQRSAHYLLNANMSPGLVGAARLQRRGNVHHYFQPVAFSGPTGTQFALAANNAFLAPETTGEPTTEFEDPRQTRKFSLSAGMLIGAVYRFRVTGIPGHPGEELFPTIEIIDRTYPPQHLATQFPIPINLTGNDFVEALRGNLVTKVVYLEDPSTALPLQESPTSPSTVDIRYDQDALQVADTMGRPVAIIRIGSKTPPSHQALLPGFFMGSPPWQPLPLPTPLPTPPKLEIKPADDGGDDVASSGKTS